MGHTLKSRLTPDSDSSAFTREDAASAFSAAEGFIFRVRPSSFGVRL